MLLANMDDNNAPLYERCIAQTDGHFTTAVAIVYICAESISRITSERQHANNAQNGGVAAIKTGKVGRAHRWDLSRTSNLPCFSCFFLTLSTLFIAFTNGQTAFPRSTTEIKYPHVKEYPRLRPHRPGGCITKLSSLFPLLRSIYH